jgi:hypothetical protein
MPVILATGRLRTEGHSLMPAQVNTLWTSISKIPREKWSGDVVQRVEYVEFKAHFHK